MSSTPIVAQSETTVLACDVGGTNTSCALVTEHNGSFSLEKRFRYKSQELSSLEEALRDVFRSLEKTAEAQIPSAVCISGAGPVRDNRCHLTNVAWKIDGHEISATLDRPVRVINDFTAISYGIPLLDTHNPDRIGSLAHPSGSPPEKEGTVRAVIGAGTGLGVGFVVDHLGEYLALPSEGGHAAFAAYDSLSRELLEYVTRQEGAQRGTATHGDDARDATMHGAAPPGAECFVSGKGIKYILGFFRETGRISPDSPLNLPDAAEEADPARLVSETAHGGDPTAIRIMNVFVENYARVASAAALHFLPLGGLYLAGGIVTKNEKWFSENDRFMKVFLENYRENIRALLHRIPVFVVRDYDVSLYGAAYGASLTLKEKNRDR